MSVEQAAKWNIVGQEKPISITSSRIQIDLVIPTIRVSKKNKTLGDGDNSMQKEQNFI